MHPKDSSIKEPDPASNSARVIRAQEAVQAHLDQFGIFTQEEREQRPATQILTDLLADLRHWADQHHVSFSEAVTISHCHWCEEAHGGRAQARR